MMRNREANVYQYLYNIGNVIGDAGLWIAFVSVASYVLYQLRRIKRALGMTREGEAAMQRIRENVMREVRSEERVTADPIIHAGGGR